MSREGFHSNPISEAVIGFDNTIQFGSSRLILAET